MKNRDRLDFTRYLALCTDAQVRGVWEKEKAARRHDYARLATDEAEARGISTYHWEMGGA